jgi:hypothetical protein
MKHIGLFIDGELELYYPNTPDCYLEIADDFKELIKDTGKLPEIKIIE